MSWSTAFVQITEPSRNLNYRGTELQDQLSRLQFTETKLPFLNQLGCFFCQSQGQLGLLSSLSAAVRGGAVAWGIFQLLRGCPQTGTSNFSKCHSKWGTQMNSQSLNLSVNVLLPALCTQTLGLLQSSKAEAAKIFSWALEMHPYLSSCVSRQKTCCPTSPGVFAARILHLQLYRTLRSRQGVWMLSGYWAALPTIPRKGQASVALDKSNQTSNTNVISS